AGLRGGLGVPGRGGQVPPLRHGPLAALLARRLPSRAAFPCASVPLHRGFPRVVDTYVRRPWYADRRDRRIPTLDAGRQRRPVAAAAGRPAPPPPRRRRLGGRAARLGQRLRGGAAHAAGAGAVALRTPLDV